ncbi:dolichyl-phosphate-mannose--protein mannosyltransferase [Brachybacterium sp. DNPG3]
MQTTDPDSPQPADPDDSSEAATAADPAPDPVSSRPASPETTTDPEPDAQAVPAPEPEPEREANAPAEAEADAVPEDEDTVAPESADDIEIADAQRTDSDTDADADHRETVESDPADAADDETAAEIAEETDEVPSVDAPAAEDISASVSEARPEVELEPAVEPQPAAGPEPEVEPEPEPEPEPEMPAASATQAEELTEPASEPAPDSEPADVESADAEPADAEPAADASSEADAEEEEVLPAEDGDDASAAPHDTENSDAQGAGAVADDDEATEAADAGPEGTVTPEAEAEVETETEPVVDADADTDGDAEDDGEAEPSAVVMLESDDDGGRGVDSDEPPAAPDAPAVAASAASDATSAPAAPEAPAASADAPASQPTAAATATATATDDREPEAVLASLRRRLKTFDMPFSRISWALTMGLFGLALVLRLWGLGTIDELIFDETYYVKDAYTISQNGVEMDWPDEPDEAFEAGDVDSYLDTGSYVVHPPLGKWVISLGMTALGADNPWGWRISVALLGSLSVLMIVRIGRRLFRSTIAGAIAGLLLAIDGMHLVHSRTSLLDLILMFFALAGFGALLIDRDRFRERLAVETARLHAAGLPGDPWGVSGGWRPWRILAGVLLGMSCSVKWSGLYFLAVFGIMTVLWDWWARRAAGEKRWWLAGLVRDAIPAFFATVGTALLTYLASWSGWFATSKGYYRNWAVSQDGGGTGFAPLDALWSLWHYHQQAYAFHVGLDSPHPYQANPLGWLLMIRPTNFYYRSYEYGEHGCQVAKCSSHILAVGNPLIWWLGTLAVLVVLVIGIVWRDGRCWAALAGIAGGYLPWLMYMDRTIFTFYAVVFEPWVVLCLAYVLALIIGPRRSDRDRRLAGGLFAGSLLVLIILVSAFFWPIWTGQVIDFEQWRWRMWLPSWT